MTIYDRIPLRFRAPDTIIRTNILIEDGELMLQVQEVELARLHPWEDNPRRNEHAVAAVAESIRTFGFNVPILCDSQLTIIAGHTRWKAAQQLGVTKVPVIIIEMTDAQRRAFSVADNKTAKIADWDFPKLRDILEELRSEDVDIKNLGFSDEELRRLLSTEGVDEDAVADVADIPPMTRPGDLYVLGNHRLLCGDSRDMGSVRVLTEEHLVDHVFGGPPYFNQRTYSHWDVYQSYLQDMRKIIENCREVMKDGAVCVWNIANGCSTHHDHVSQHSRLFEECQLQYLDTIIWKKTGANYAVPRNFHILRNGCYYPALEWEALLVYQKPGPMPKMARGGKDYMSRYHTDVWEIPAVTNQTERFGHPAVCPVEIPYRSIQAYTGSEGSIFEPFGGSGTTLVAAEKAGRSAYVIEMNPAYCDAIVKRWESISGMKASRVGN
ncbi:MAG: DNA modification methylase [Chloroflexi bacterium]|nr:DNA modification methylase [Chloroflexota bacterium]